MRPLNRIVSVIILLSRCLTNCHGGCSESRGFGVAGKIPFLNFTKYGGEREFCNYAINITSKESINLTFTSAELQNTDEHLTNFILVFDGPDCMSKRIGVVYNSTVAKFNSSGPSITALLVSDAETKSEKFSAEYTATMAKNATVPQEPFDNSSILTSCGLELTGDRGNITHLGTGKNNEFCVWRITAQEGKNINIQIESVTIRSNISWLRFINGGTCGRTLQLTYRGGQEYSPTSWTSSGNQVTLVFSSPAAQTGQQFKVSYSTLVTTTRSTTTVSSEHSQEHVTRLPSGTARAAIQTTQTDGASRHFGRLLFVSLCIMQFFIHSST